MIVRNCKKLLNDISSLENQISRLEALAISNSLEIDVEGLLTRAFEDYIKLKNT
jgi:hypothetical protein